ncbi:hypothetical protein CLORY_16860 [Clostridium oryzae]|uniref:Uncharacterized protein n=1 Tax=Clostridium oryzae TaxID=1450648 RepID=A0A1V4IRJ4_9CLOT|nr:hypothetical protein CLORY_16860 [Clostridium oryzae]
MKKINSNDIGAKVVAVIIGFCVIFPIFFYVLKN